MYTLKKIATELNATVEVIRNDLSNLVLQMFDANDSGASNKVSQVLNQIDNLEGSTEDKLNQLLEYVPEMPVEAPIHPVFAKLLLGDKFDAEQVEQPKKSGNGGMGGSLAEVETLTLGIIEGLPESIRAEYLANRNFVKANVKLKAKSEAMEDAMEGRAAYRETLARVEKTIADMERNVLVENYRSSQNRLAELLGLNYRLTNEANQAALEAQEFSDAVDADTNSFLDKLNQMSQKNQAESEDIVNIFRQKKAS